MGNRIKKILEKISKFLNFSPNVLVDDLTATVFSGRQVVLNGYNKIVEFDSSMIVVARGVNQIVLYGSNLRICELGEEFLIVEGEIKSIEF